MQRTFVGVDACSVFQEIVLRGTDDPRVNNIVRFSEKIGELKVEVYTNEQYHFLFTQHVDCSWTSWIVDEAWLHVQLNF